MREQHRPPGGTPHTEVFREISQIKMTSIVCTPARLVDLLEHADGVFTLRETTFDFGGRGASSMQSIHLQRHELDKLGHMIPRVLAESREAAISREKMRGEP
jgi:hypothetical protein